jgi:hypothetical protein
MLRIPRPASAQVPLDRQTVNHPKTLKGLAIRRAFSFSTNNSIPYANVNYR